MTEEDRKLLDVFESRLRHLMFLHAELQQENLELKRLLQEKEEEIAGVRNDYRALEANYTDLKQARIIGIHDEELKDTKQRLSRLVREVDKCIALLNE